MVRKSALAYVVAFSGASAKDVTQRCAAQCAHTPAPAAAVCPAAGRFC